MKSRVAKKLIIGTVVFSSIITLLITAVQLYTEFQYDVKGINQKLDQIKISYKENITQAVWISDKSQLKIILDGITELPDVVYATVRLGVGNKIISGRVHDDEVIEYKFPLSFLYNNKNIDIGEVEVVASLADVYSRLYKRLWIILF